MSVVCCAGSGRDVRLPRKDCLGQGVAVFVPMAILEDQEPSLGKHGANAVMARDRGQRLFPALLIAGCSQR
jgi:hypothetical protein